MFNLYYVLSYCKKARKLKKKTNIKDCGINLNSYWNTQLSVSEFSILSSVSAWPYIHVVDLALDQCEYYLGLV